MDTKDVGGFVRSRRHQWSETGVMTYDRTERHGVPCPHGGLGGGCGGHASDHRQREVSSPFVPELVSGTGPEAYYAGGDAEDVDFEVNV